MDWKRVKINNYDMDGMNNVINNREDYEFSERNT
jgi:hypothetical protein